MAKKHTTQLTFIVQAEIQVQEVSPKEKKEKGTLMTFPMAKKRRISTYFQSSNRNQRCKKASSKEQRKRNVNGVLKAKKNTPPNLP
jgi:hypothetical protein